MKEATSNTNLVLEVLIATMNRTSLSFIEKMFPHNKLENLRIIPWKENLIKELVDKPYGEEKKKDPQH